MDAEGFYFSDYAPKYTDNQIDITFTMLRKWVVNAGNYSDRFHFFSTPDETGEITGLNNVEVNGFPEGFKAYIDDYFIYDNSMMDPENYQSLEFDVDLEVDLNGDNIIDVETEEHLEHFKLVNRLWITEPLVSGEASMI